MSLPQPLTPGPWSVVYTEAGSMDGVRHTDGTQFQLVNGVNAVCLAIAELLNQAEALQ